MDPLQIMLALGLLFVVCRLFVWLVPERIPSLNVDASDVTAGDLIGEKYIFVPRSAGGESPDRVPCYDPATMSSLGTSPVTTPSEVQEIVYRAREAQKLWAKTSFNQRRLLLKVLLRYILENQELICRASAKDSGKTLLDTAIAEVLTTCEKISYLLKEGEQVLRPERRSTGLVMIHKSARVEYHPRGVIGAIVPWNYPFHNIFNPMLAAVFSGNAIVIKVSEHTTWSGGFYLRIIQSALKVVGAPADLVHIVSGYAETGSALVSCVDKVIFVGSTAVGRKVMETAAKTLTPVTLELGGKDPFIVCDDADLSQVVPMALRATFQGSGQNCAGAERFYVQEGVYDHFVKEVAKAVKSMRAGRPLEDKCDMGAICMPNHVEKLHELVTDAVGKGAKVAARGDIISSDGVGQYFPPTLLIDVSHSMRLMQEEIFGPILNVMKFKTDEDAIKLANDSVFGLGCAVFSGNKKRANAIASSLHCGMAAINDFGTFYLCQSLPFGGVKDSGFGKFAGEEGLRALCVVKAVCEDRFPLVKTTIPKPLQYPVADNAFQLQEATVRLLYGWSWTTKLFGLVDTIKVLLSGSPQKKQSRGKTE